MYLARLYRNLRRRSLYGSCLRAPGPAVILRYHSIGEPDAVARYLDPGLSVPPDRFREQVRELKARFEFATLDDLQSGALPRKGRRAVVITFDDGYKDNHDVALPILQDEGARATFYVTTGPLAPGATFWISELWRLARALPPGNIDLPAGAPANVPADAPGRTAFRRAMTRFLSGVTAAAREQVLDRLAARAGLARGAGLEGAFMTPDDLRRLRDAGMTVGAHTRTHPHLNRVDAAEHEGEVNGSRRDLEDALGERVRHFAYPNPSSGGPVTEQARRSVVDAGFETAVTSFPAPLRPGADLLRLPRLGVYAGDQDRVLFGLLRRVRPA